MSSHHTDGKIHVGEASNDVRQMRHNQRQNAQLHLLHDYGLDGAKYLVSRYSQHELQKGILTQRAEMTINGTLYNEEGKLAGRIDLARLGVSAADIAQVEALHAAEKERSSGFASRVADAPVIFTDENVHDYPAKGGAAR